MSSDDREVLGIFAAAGDGKVPSKVKAVRELASLKKAWPQHARIRFLRNYTVETIEPLLRFACYQNGISLDLSFSDFDGFEREVFDNTSKTHTGKHELLVLALWLDLLVSPEDHDRLDVDAIFNRTTTLLAQLLKTNTASLAANLFLPPFFAGGSVEAGKTHDLLHAKVNELNQKLTMWASTQDRVFLVDFPALMAKLGESATLDPRFWYMSSAPLKMEFLDLWAGELAGMLAATKGRIKKVLVLDCDNTLWGGIVGEDGLDGIALGPEKYPGNAFYDFQRQVLSLKDRGILIALCSKNNEADVLEVLDKHPHSLLKRSDFVGWAINWNDKAQNLRDLAKRLNLGLDSFVFVDDSAIECDLVRLEIPGITVLQTPEKVFELSGLLKNYRGFDRLKVSEEDAKKTQLYQEEGEREKTKAQFTDLKTYLRSLELSVEIDEVKDKDVVRIAQLTQKTNQFNLTTRRYTEGDIERFQKSERAAVFGMRAKDKYGSYGLSAAAILLQEEDVVVIDSFLMSCRILGRHLEDVFLAQLIDWALRRPGVKQLRASYIPTLKNSQVAAFYDRFHFKRTDKAAPNSLEATREYIFKLDGPRIEIPEFITVVREQKGEVVGKGRD